MNANHPANVKIIYPDAAWNPLSCDCGLEALALKAAISGGIQMNFQEVVYYTYSRNLTLHLDGHSSETSIRSIIHEIRVSS
ncbi:hypothetical protein Bca4012_090179 [Brassica carinata]